MEGVKVGDVVKGFGTRKKAACVLYVDKLNMYPYDAGIASVSGRIIGPDRRVSLKEETILKAPRMNEVKINIAEPEEKIFDTIGGAKPVQPGGWEIIHDFQIEGPTVTLTSRIRALDVGESIEVLKEENSRASCRATASLLQDTTGRSFKVNKTPDGCKITRTA